MNPEDKIQNQIDTTVKDTAQDNQFTVSSTSAHTHNGIDSLLITTIDLPAGNPIKLGLGGIISFSNDQPAGDSNEVIQTDIVAGRDQNGTVGTTTDNLEFSLVHQPQSISYLQALRPPDFGYIDGTKISTTLGGNTVTAPGGGFVTDSLIGALINIFDSSGTFIETQKIASNTATVITINGTWLATTTNGTLFIFTTVYLGIFNTPFQTLYIQEGATGGIRFGVGPTGGGQNGLLYMDAAGDLYWRNKAGTSFKLDFSAPITSTTQIFTANGTYTKPAGLLYVIVECVGGGAGGEGQVGGGFGGCGGGGGGYSRKVIDNVSLGATTTVTVGTGGVGTAGAFTNGGTTTFTGFNSAGGGAIGGSGLGGAGGQGSNGDINTVGGSGASGLANGTAFIGGMGGSSFFGGGGRGRSTDGIGLPGGNYGGGGGGGVKAAAVSTAGGAGADGVCFVTEYY